jgi:hypothetical protein
MNLPQRFFSSQSDCGCANAPSPSVPCATPGGATICDPRYYTMTYLPSGQILGIAPGTNCQVKIQEGAAGGLLVSLGTGLGFGATVAPALALPVQPMSEGAFVPFMLGAMGAEPTTPWKRFVGPTSGTFFLTWTPSGFTLTDATDLPNLINTFAAAGNGPSLEMVGYVQTGTVDGEPVFEARKLIGSGTGTQPLVLVFNGTTGRYEVRAAALDAPYNLGAVGIVTFFEQTGGVMTAGGFSIRPNSGITQADIYGLLYDSGAKKVYRAPAHTQQQKSYDVNVAHTIGDTYVKYAGHLQFDSATFNYPTVLISWMVCFSTQEQCNVGLFRDDTLIMEWNFDVSGQPNSTFGTTYLDTEVALGVHVYDLRIRQEDSDVESKTIFFSSCNLTTLSS